MNVKDSFLSIFVYMLCAYVCVHVCGNRVSGWISSSPFWLDYLTSKLHKNDEEEMMPHSLYASSFNGPIPREGLSHSRGLPEVISLQPSQGKMSHCFSLPYEVCSIHTHLYAYIKIAMLWMYVCIYMCMCDLCTHIDIHLCDCIYIYMYLYRCVYIYVCVIYTDIYVWIYNTNLCMWLCIHVDICVYMHTDIDRHIYTHRYTFVYPYKNIKKKQIDTCFLPTVNY